MRLKTHTLLLGLLAVLAISLAPSMVKAQGLKIGWIDDEKIKLGYDAWQRAQEQWGIERQAWENEAIEMEQELNDLIQEYEQQRLILSEDKQKEREAAINTKQEALDDYTRSTFGPNGKAEQKQYQLIQPLINNINKAIEAVAIEGNYDVIFTLQSGLGYIKEGYEVTEEVLAQLDRIE